MDFSKPHLARLASFFIVPEHCRERLLELQSDTLPHDALGIYSVYESFDRRFEQISFSDFDHFNLNNTMSAARQPRAGGSDRESTL